MKKSIREKASRIVDEARESARDLAELLRRFPGGKKLNPERVPVRVD